jgi:hypothetical protein
LAQLAHNSLADILRSGYGPRRQSGFSMDAKEQLLKSRSELFAVLDAKFKDVPEWRAYRAVEAALYAFMNGVMVTPPKRERVRLIEETDEPASYVELALKALDTHGRPMSTPELVDFIGRHRKVPPDPQKARTNISSGFSRDKRLRNVSWHNGRAWWFSDRAVPEQKPAAE